MNTNFKVIGLTRLGIEPQVYRSRSRRSIPLGHLIDGICILRIRVKKFNQNFPENYSKSTKIAITACNFSKIFRGSMPPDPPRALLVSQSASNLFCQKTIRLTEMWKLWPPFNVSRYAPVSSKYYKCSYSIVTLFYHAENIFRIK